MSTVQHHPGQHRFEADIDGARGEVVYRLDGDVMTILHTEVDPALEGKGVAGRLVQAALDHASAHALKVNPVCSYASAYMQRHPDTEALRAGPRQQPGR